MPKIDYTPEMGEIIDNLFIGQTNNKIRCVLKYLDEVFVESILEDTTDGTYFIHSQKDGRNNGFILDLDHEETGRIEAYAEVLQVFKRIGYITEKYDREDDCAIIDCLDKYLQIEVQHSNLATEIISYCTKLVAEKLIFN